jgi:hypothetical protein
VFKAVWEGKPETLDWGAFSVLQFVTLLIAAGGPVLIYVALDRLFPRRRR